MSGDATRDLRDAALRLLVDYLAVTRAGAGSPAAEAGRRSVADVAAGGPAIVEGCATRRPVVDAAFLNGLAAHAIELDDTHEGASLHPGVAVWPAVLAVADARGCSLETILDAAIAGYDETCALGRRLGPAHVYARGFHPTGISGPPGAAVAVAALLGLTGEDRAAAGLLATSMSSGLLTFLDGGGWTKPLQAGHAAAAGVRAGLLAAAGFDGPEPAAAASRVTAAFGGEPGDPHLAPPGHGVLETSVKLYPCCRYMHGCIDLLLDAEVRPEAVARVECAILPGGWSLVADPIEPKRRPALPVEAQFSMPYAAAAALSLGRYTQAEVDAVGSLAPGWATLMDRVVCVRDEELDAAYPDRWGARVRIVTDADEVIELREEAFLGSPAEPAPDEVLERKLAGLAGAAWARAAMELLGAPSLDRLHGLRSAECDGGGWVPAGR